MALSTVSSLSESFISSEPLTAEEAAPTTEKEKEGSLEEPDQSEPGPSNVVPSTPNGQSPPKDGQDQEMDSEDVTKVHGEEPVQDEVTTDDKSSQNVTEQLPEPSEPGQKDDQTTSSPDAQSTEPLPAQAVGDKKLSRGSGEDGGESDASSDDEAVLQIHG